MTNARDVIRYLKQIDSDTDYSVKVAKRNGTVVVTVMDKQATAAAEKQLAKKAEASKLG